MTCEEIEAGELAEKYVLGQMNADEQSAYEDHYFACSHCFEELQLRQTMQSELAALGVPRRERRSPWALWAAAAAILIVAAGVGWWRLRPAASTASSTSVHVSPPAPSSPSLDVLARFEPPTYTAPVLRGGAPLDTAFRSAMEKYREGLYAAAIPGLLEAARTDEKDADAQFFLGICYLMDGQSDAAIRRLRATIRLGDTLNLEMAHFYLAKALIRKGDTAGAAAELDRAIAVHGDREAQARELLEQLKSLPGVR